MFCMLDCKDKNRKVVKENMLRQLNQKKLKGSLV